MGNIFLVPQLDRGPNFLPGMKDAITSLQALSASLLQSALSGPQLWIVLDYSTFSCKGMLHSQLCLSNFWCDMVNSPASQNFERIRGKVQNLVYLGLILPLFKK